jgi:inner membrane protein
VIKTDGERTPAFKLLIAILIAAALAIPIFMVWFLVYDRQSQSEQARASITEGWGGPQAIAGPVLVIPYRAAATETVIERGQSVTRSRDVLRELTLAPEAVALTTDIQSQHRKRSIYEAVIYDAKVAGSARFAMPPDLARFGVAMADLRLDRAELRFSLSDPRGLGANPRVVAQGAPLRLQPGGGPSSSILPCAAMARSAWRRRRATPAGPCARPGRTPASSATSCHRAGGWQTMASPRLIGSAIWRSAGRW